MTKIPIAWGLAACALYPLAACTTPADVTKPIGEGQHNDAKVEVKDIPNGFSVFVRYDRYQFIPETGALLVACKSLVTARAYEEAKSRGREIEPINEQAIRVSTGRNGVLGLTFCHAFAESPLQEIGVFPCIVITLRYRSFWRCRLAAAARAQRAGATTPPRHRTQSR